jgi:hypothetical protein
MVIPELLGSIILQRIQTVPFKPSSAVITPTTGIPANDLANELERRDDGK